MNNMVPSKVNSGNLIKPKQALFDWAFMGTHTHGSYSDILKQLKDLALPEQWYYGHSIPSDGKLPILDNYFRYTFFKLKKEGKILEGDEFAAFNTGLVNKTYKDIFALFKKHEDEGLPWSFNSFCVEGEDWGGKRMVSEFKELPLRANYFNEPVEMIYDTTAGKPSLDHTHILVENASRLPFAFLEENCPKGFHVENIETMDFNRRQEYFTELSSAVKGDERNLRYMKGRLDDAVDLALKRTIWNFKTAIPMYYPTTDKMSLLLPLALVNDDNVDVALVVGRQKSGNYIGHTILPLDWAYSNARLITRPDSDWLIAKKINNTTEDTDD